MNKELKLKIIDESNFVECFNLKLGKNQDKFVSHPIRSLAQAYVYYNQCTPFGIYKENVMVGYVMVIYDYDEEMYNIWHMMIDGKYQNNGYETKALELCLEYIKSKPFGESNNVVLTCSIENDHGIYIYNKLGFKEIGN
ncbi:MAG: GNAT family N-acetyltransferase [Paraclostridium bifermentans]|uniref:GNAT family N-acetyltransferase n=1 Tax=Paraclostridium bifermentans TaxID=1490 RepID=UPI0011DE0802|nr:GNAT family N-acetyltransferase [Paraclostridium bifermentans]MBS6508440.1 GNAT family N-acetyltransferase [Paraclostridium bifermentans]